MGGRRGVVCLGLVAITLAGTRASEAADRGERKPRLLLPFDAALVREAVAGARERLGTPACRSLVDEFKTPEGVALGARLEEGGVTLEEQLGALRFFDASDFTSCRSGRVYAFTKPGQSAVYVCTARFASARRQEPLNLELVVIHELLHSIGLAENPPSPEHINARVKDRCHAREAAGDPERR